MNVRVSIFGPATTTIQAVVGAVITVFLALLIGFGLNQPTASTVFTGGLIGLATLTIGLKRARTAHN